MSLQNQSPPPDPESGSKGEPKNPEKPEPAKQRPALPEPLPPELQNKLEFDRYTGVVKYRDPPGMWFLGYLIELMAPIHATNAKGIRDNFNSRGYIARTAYMQAMALCLKYKLAVETTLPPERYAEFEEQLRQAALLLAEGTRIYEAWQNERRGNIVFVEPRQKVKK